MMFLAAMMMAEAPTAAQPIEAPTVAPVVKPTKEQKVCKDNPDFTGSRLRKRICLTPTEWANKAATTANDLKNMGAR